MITHESLDQQREEVSVLVEEQDDNEKHETNVPVEHLKGFNLKPISLHNIPASMYPAIEQVLRRVRTMNEPIGITESPYSMFWYVYTLNFLGQAFLPLISDEGPYGKAWNCLPWCLLLIFLGFVARLIKIYTRRKQEMYFSWTKDLESNSILISELSRQETARLKLIKEEENFSVGGVSYFFMLLFFGLATVIGYNLYPDAYLMALISFPLYITSIVFGGMGMFLRNTDVRRKRGLAVIVSIIFTFLPCYLVYLMGNLWSWSFTSTFGVLSVTFPVTGILGYYILSSELQDEK